MRFAVSVVTRSERPIRSPASDAPAGEVRRGERVGEDRDAGALADHVGPGGGNEAAVDANAAVDALGDGLRREPRPEPEAIEPIELACIARAQRLDAGIENRAE